MWTYDATDLVTSTSSGRLNIVRLLVGDTDTTDQILQDEEIEFALSVTGNDTYFAGAWSCNVIAAKYSRFVDSKIESTVSSNYSDLVKHYNLLATKLLELGKKSNGRSLGIYAGGISDAVMDTVAQDTDRPTPSFRVEQFSNPSANS